VVSLPVWALISVALGSPILSFLGVLLAQFITRKSAAELEARSKREETMRNLRWAAELAVNLDERMADLGVAQLRALLGSQLLDDSEKIFVEAALGAVYDDAKGELDRLGDDASAVQILAADDVGITDDLN
jgi:hypothetical protein